jgi:hypothetical protein
MSRRAESRSVADLLLGLASLAATMMLAACAKTPGAGLPSDALDQAIGAGIGDPTTCVVIAARAGHKILYHYGNAFNCRRGLPACDRPGTLSAEGALALADAPGGRTASCPSSPDGARTVGWAQGRAASRSRDLIYSAVMEGERALPGQEMSARLDDAFQKVGL